MPQEPERFAHSRANDLVGRQHEEANEFLIKKRASIRGASRRPADAAARGCRVPQIPHPVVLTARRVSSAMYSLVPENSLAKIRKIGFRSHALRFRAWEPGFERTLRMSGECQVRGQKATGAAFWEAA